ncbi:WD40 repeat domain-containing serine/threonine protein kinase [Nonomuraea sp. NPDC049714]|uniref:WD40 repeat domain-containing serine/threonine protein kinase n=1 Tax=Nonomuraea sp. NPDC049714 TaxID=3364357 RepID=UPI0037ADE678
MVDSRPLRPGEPERVGPYRLLACLGEGGQGAVYRACNAAGDEVAIKLLHARLDGDERASTRFLREAKAARQVAQFCTARVLDAGIHEGISYIVTELVDGESLDKVVRREGPRDFGALERLAVSTATALAAIHRAGIVHRDFKPQNVLLGPDGVRVIDFGIAKMVGSSASTTQGLIGTPAYMSPEQISGGEVGPASDMFSWAATLLFAATGRNVFNGENVAAAMHRVLHHEPELPPLPEPLRELVARALAKDPRRRPAAHEVILRLVGHDPVAGSGRLSGEGPHAGNHPLAEAGRQTTNPLLERTRPRARLPIVAGTLAITLAATAALLWLLPGSGDRLTTIGLGNGHDVVAVALAGERALVAEESAVTFWDLAADKHLSLAHLPSQTADITSMAASRELTLTGHADGTVSLWNVAGDDYVGNLDGHVKRVNAVALAQLEGKTVGLTGGADRTIRVWDLNSRSRIRTIDAGLGEIAALAAIEVDGTPVAVSLDGSDDTLRLWDLRSGKQLGAPLAEETGNGIAVGNLDGTPIVVSSDLRVWDLRTRRLIREIEAPGDTLANAVGVGTVDGAPVIVSTVQGADLDYEAIQMWNLRTGAPVGSLIEIDYVPDSLAVGAVKGAPVVMVGQSTDAAVWRLRLD